MTARVLLEHMKYLQEIAPEDLDLEVTFEPEESWSSWTFAEGISKRSKHGKVPVINIRVGDDPWLS